MRHSKRFGALPFLEALASRFKLKHTFPFDIHLKWFPQGSILMKKLLEKIGEGGEFWFSLRIL
jgi:hypothetical protein